MNAFNSMGKRLFQKFSNFSNTCLWNYNHHGLSDIALTFGNTILNMSSRYDWRYEND